MATGFAATATAGANAMLDAWAAEYDYIQLHTGDPGAAGTSNVAGNDTRKLVSWASASGGLLSNDAAVEWDGSEVDTSEDYTHASFWTAATDGTFGGSFVITANPVTSGNEAVIATGDIDIALTVAS